MATCLVAHAEAAQLWITNTGPNPDPRKVYTDKINTSFQFLFTNSLSGATNLGTPSATVQGLYQGRDGSGIFQLRSIEVASDGGLALYSNGTTLILSNTAPVGAGSGASNAVVRVQNNTNANAWLDVGTSGTDFNITTNGIGANATNYFNLPIASASNTGKLAATDWQRFDGVKGSNYTTRADINSSNYVNRTELNGSNYVARTELNGSNYVNRTELNGSNYTTRADITSSNYTTRADITSSNYTTRADITSSNYTTRADINSSNYVNRTELNGSNYVVNTRTLTVAGTANRITSSAGAQDLSANRTWTLDIADVFDLGSITSFEVPNAAAPTTDAFGELAGDNNAWASGRGALQFYDGTANTYIIGVQVTDTPTASQVPTFNADGTITWETPPGGAGSQTPIAQDVNWALFAATNMGRLELKRTLVRGMTNLISTTPVLDLTGPGRVRFQPTNVSVIDVRGHASLSTNWVDVVVQIISTGASPHSITFSNCIAGNALALLGDQTNHFQITFDGNTNWVWALQEDFKQPAHASLTNLVNLTGTGFAVKTSATAWTNRSFADTATISWSEAAGQTGNPAASVIDDSISNAKIRNSAAVSVIGRTGNSSGDPADITAAANGQYLKRTNDAVVFGVIANGDLPNPLIAPGSVTATIITNLGITYLPTGGTPGAPTLTFDGDADTGIYQGTANNVRISAGGALQVTVGPALIVLETNTQIARTLTVIEGTVLDSTLEVNGTTQLDGITTINTNATVKSPLNGGQMLVVTNTSTDHTSDTILLGLYANDSADANTIFQRIVDDADGTPVTVWEAASTLVQSGVAATNKSTFGAGGAASFGSTIRSAGAVTLLSTLDVASTSTLQGNVTATNIDVGALKVTNNITYLTANMVPTSQGTNFTVDFLFGARTYLMTNAVSLGDVSNVSAADSQRPWVLTGRNYSGGALRVRTDFRRAGTNDVSVANNQNFIATVWPDGTGGTADTNFLCQIIVFDSP